MMLKDQCNVEEAHQAAEDQCVALESMIDQLCSDLPEVAIPSIGAPTIKLESLDAMLKASWSKIIIVCAEL